jgi:serine/threonine protein kinase
MAVKILKSEKETSYVISLVKQEAELLHKLNHPNIVKVKHLIQLNGRFYMGMDLLAGGSLYSLVKEK